MDATYVIYADGRRMPVPEKRKLVPHPDDQSLMLVPFGGKKGRGMFAVIDKADAAEVARYNWTAVLISRTWYAQTSGAFADRSVRVLRLHRLIAELAGFGDAQEVDHENGNGLDCRRRNLRPATKVENGRNSRIRPDNSSGIKGVSRGPKGRKWRACFQFEKRQYHIGLFATIEEAGAAIRAERDRLHGEFANHGDRRGAAVAS